MPNHLDELYTQRLNRYVTAMRNGMPDRVPVRPFAAEITANYAGFTCQQATHDYRRASRRSSAAAMISIGMPRFPTWSTCGPA